LFYLISRKKDLAPGLDEQCAIAGNQSVIDNVRLKSPRNQIKGDCRLLPKNHTSLDRTAIGTCEEDPIFNLAIPYNIEMCANALQ